MKRLFLSIALLSIIAYCLAPAANGQSCGSPPSCIYENATAACVSAYKDWCSSCDGRYSSDPPSCSLVSSGSNGGTYREKLDAEHQARDEARAEYKSYSQHFDQAVSLNKQAIAVFRQDPREAIRLAEQALSELDVAGQHQSEGPNTRQFRSDIQQNLLLYRAVSADSRGDYEGALGILRGARNSYPGNAKYWDGVIASVQREIQDKKESDPKYLEQKRRQEESQATSAIQGDINSLVDKLGSATAQTRTEWHNVNGTMVPFTVLDHPGSGPGRAGDQLRGIAADDRRARNSSSREDAADRLELGFDTPGAANGSLSPVVIGSGSAQIEIPPNMQKDQIIRENLKVKADAEQRYQQLGDQLKELQRKISSNEGDKGALQVQQSQILDQMSAAKSDAATAVVHIQDRKRQLDLSLNFTEESH